MFHATKWIMTAILFQGLFFSHETRLDPARCNIPPKVVFTCIPLTAQYLGHELWIDRCSRHPFLCPASQVLYRCHLGARASLKSSLMRNVRNWKQPKKTSNVLKLCRISVSSSAWLRSLGSLWHEIHGLERQQNIVGKSGKVDNLVCSILDNYCNCSSCLIYIYSNM